MKTYQKVRNSSLGNSALSVLLKRRPDLAEIELSVANSNTLLPYADLVLEILENAASDASPHVIDISASDFEAVVTALKAGAVHPSLQIVLSSITGITWPGSADTRVHAATDSEWHIGIPGYQLSIERSNTTLTLSLIVSQTSETADAIAQQPEHVNPAAYDALRQAGYPWSLPFDLWTEEARVYLAHLGVPRDVLIQTFDPYYGYKIPEAGSLGAPNVMAATERFGLTVAEMEIITGRRKGTGRDSDPNTGLWNFWGFRAQNLGSQPDGSSNTIPDPTNSTTPIGTGKWLDWLVGATSRVDVVLQQSGLTYNELRELLDMRFVNTTDAGVRVLELQLGTQDLVQNSPSFQIPSSDLSLARLLQSDSTIAESDVTGVLDRLHRFVRLWRKTGWLMRDLDRAILWYPRSGASVRRVLDLGTILTIDREMRRIQLHRQQPEAFFSLFATEQYRDYSAAGEPIVVSLYDRLFLNKSITNRLDPAFELNNTRTELKIFETNPQVLMRDYMAHVAAACGLSRQDADNLLQWTGMDFRLKLENLSTIFWAGFTARCASVSISDLLDLTSRMASTILFASSIPDDQKRIQSPIELGFKFRSLAPTAINCVRFWKPEGETGQHIGRLWDATGKLLAVITFQNETDSGWQEQQLIQPVSIQEDGTYVVSVNANTIYGLTENGITSSPMGSLIAVADGNNGVTGELGRFPDQSDGNSPNYFRGIGYRTITRPPIVLLETVRAAGFSPAEALYLLSHKQSSSDAQLENKEMTGILDEIRKELSAIALGASPMVDSAEAKGDAVRRELIALGWHPQVISQVIEVIEEAFSVPLGKLPDRVKLPNKDQPGGCVSLIDGRLTSTKFLADSDQDALLGLSNNSSYTAAVNALADLSTQRKALAAGRIDRDLSSYEPRDTATLLASWPSELTLPQDIADRIYYDKLATELHFVGSLDDTSFARIEKLIAGIGNGNGAPFLAAIEKLRDDYANPAPGVVTMFDGSEREKFLDGLATPADRYAFVLDKLIAHRRYVQSLKSVQDKLATGFGLASAAVGKLLTEWLWSSAGSAQGFAMADFLQPDFVQGNPSLATTQERFPHQFATCLRIKKVAILVSKFRLSERSLGWLFKQTPDKYGWFGWIDPNRLPTGTNESPVSIRPFLRLANLCRVRDALPGGDEALDRVFTAAGKTETDRPAFLAEVASATGWLLGELTTLVGQDGFNLGNGPLTDEGLKSAFEDEWLMLHLVQCFAVMRRLGAKASQCLEWSKPEITRQAAADIKRLCRARYTDKTWSDVAKPLQNALRETQRAALVAYLIGKNQLRDSNDLYNRYLIDVEMQPVVMTSRIKQACASVQLFVQRILLNLEPEVPPTVIDTKLWAWMKNYRVWEANRKVFLFPENWIEPELRDDKSEFFRQLESELLQSNITHEAGLEAFKSYVEKLGDVARLTVISMFDEVLEEGNKRVVHLIGRDGSAPHRYYYRQWIIPGGADAGYWTAWEEVSAGIDSEHVLIFKFGGKVQVAWPTIRSEGGAGLMKITMNVIHRTQTGWSAPKRGQGQIWWAAPPNIDEDRGLQFSIQSSSPSELQITCIGAWFDKKVDQPSSFYLDANDSYDNAALQKGTTNTRVLAKYRDTFGRIYYWVCEDTTLTRTLLYKDGRDPLSVDRLNSIDWTEGRYAEPLRASVIHMLAIFISVSIPIGSGYKVSGALRESISIEKASEFSWVGDFVVDVTDVNKLSYINLDLERTLEYRDLGNFSLLQPGNFVANESTSLGTVTPDIPFQGAQLFKSNFREKIPKDRSNADDLSTLQSRLLKSTPGRFVITQNKSSKQETWGVNAYSDQQVDLIFSHTHGDDTYKLIPSSLWWSRLIADQLDKNSLIKAMEVSQLPVPLDQVIDFDPQGVDSTSITTMEIRFDSNLPLFLYNWETFFHVPLLVANQLTQNQRFEEAQHWLHLVFDPTSGQSGNDVRHFWRFKPFRTEDTQSSIELELQKLAAGNTTLHDQITAWKENPFQPHMIARSRHRAYQLFVLRKYLDNLIAWGDQLFRRDTIESINEATQLYILASEILGRRPRQIKTHKKANDRTYSQLPALDDFSNALVRLESLIPAVGGGGGAGGGTGGNSLVSLYFGIPANEQFLEHWDTVEDRLFKIRHSLNVEGVARQLPLYEPPIDPAVLVRAVAAGVDIASALADLQSPLPHYRFSSMTQKALELANEVKSFASGLLAALEKQDTEGLALLRSSQEISMLKLVQTVKETQRDEAAAGVESLRKTRELIAQRYLQYQHLLGNTSVVVPAEGASVSPENTPAKALVDRQANGDMGGLALTGNESDHLYWLERANGWMWASGATKTLSGVLHAFPDTMIPLKTGGSHLGSAAGAVADFMQAMGSDAGFHSSRSSTIAGHQRRYDEWAFQSNLAAKELEQVDKQIAAAELRVAIAKHELSNHQKQMDNAQEVDDYMHDKFTNAQLYRWMTGQASGMYFRAYQMAYDMAKRAEKAYRFELGLEDKDSNFIQYGYWDSLKKGLFAGEKLGLDIKRMEVAYLDKNRREFEITRHISLRRLAPEQLIALYSTGSCEFEIPEWLYDLDGPGQFMRRLKTVSLSVPCIIGPYTGVFCKLTLLHSRIRKSANAAGYDVTRPMGEDSRFVDYLGAVESVVTSSSSNDSGLFETNLRDERYLPFEGRGAIGRWRIELPDLKLAQFDYHTISDAILHVRYTAREGGDELRQAARKVVETELTNSGAIIVDVKRDFPTEWARASNSPTTDIKLTLSKDMLPYVFSKATKRRSVMLFDGKLNADDRPIGLKPLSVDESGENDLDKPIALGTMNDLLQATNKADPVLVVGLMVP